MDSTTEPTQSFFSSWNNGEGVSFSPGLTLDESPQSWRPDEFTLHEGYQEYREELRSLIFNTANSQVAYATADSGSHRGHAHRF